VEATGLTPGNTYYLMIDGYAGDQCDYTIYINSGVQVALNGTYSKENGIFAHYEKYLIFRAMR
jgi:hypothetical protein